MSGLEALAEKGVQTAVVTPWRAKVGEVAHEGFADLKRYVRVIGLAD
jgi:hypothetical protein